MAVTNIQQNGASIVMSTFTVAENESRQLSKIWGIYLCELRNIFIFCRIYLGELENVSKFCESYLFKVI